jgi:hypothetical protein
VFKTKRQAGGIIARYKARLCEKWLSKIHGLDYNETSATTSKFTALRAIFSLVAHFNLPCEQTDVDCAFLHADVDVEIYIDQPQWFD